MEVNIALLQEACCPPDDIAARFKIDPAPWFARGQNRRVTWRSAIRVRRKLASWDVLEALSALFLLRGVPRCSRPYLCFLLFGECGAENVEHVSMRVTASLYPIAIAASSG